MQRKGQLRSCKWALCPSLAQHSLKCQHPTTSMHSSRYDVHTNTCVCCRWGVNV